MKPEPVIIRILAACLALAIFAYCGAMALGIQMQADRDNRTIGCILALCVAFWGLLLGGGFLWSTMKRRK